MLKTRNLIFFVWDHSQMKSAERGELTKFWHSKQGGYRVGTGIGWNFGHWVFLLLCEKGATTFLLESAGEEGRDCLKTGKDPEAALISSRNSQCPKFQPIPVPTLYPPWSAVSPFRMSFLFSQVSWNSKSEKEHSEWQDETVQVWAALLLLVEERQLDTIRHIVKC